MTKKQYSTPKASVGAVKKSIAAITSWWLLRNAAHRFAGSGLRGALSIQRRTVRSDTSKPSIVNSPCIRGAPHVGFSATIRKMSSRSSLLTGFLPALTRCREIHFQYNLKPSRCHRTTVEGSTIRSTLRHAGQRPRNAIQKSLSVSLGRDRGRFLANAASCCRKARFSSKRSRRERKT